MVNLREGPVFVISSAGRRVELLRSIRRGFSDLNPVIIAIDSSSQVPARFEADHFYQVPSVESPSFQSALQDIVAERGVNYLVPTIDSELLLYSRLRNDQSLEGVDILVSSPRMVALANDKLAFARFVENVGLPAIKTQSLDDYQLNWDNFPAFIKPRSGSSSLGSRVVRGPSEFMTSDFSNNMVIQPLKEGNEYTIDFGVNKDGRLLGYSIRERIKVHGGEVVTSMTRKNSQLEEMLQVFVDRSPGLYGVLNLQVIHHGDSYEILELNARVGGGYPLTHLAGCDLFRAVVSGGFSELATTEEGFLMLRYHESFVIPPVEE